MNKKKYTKDILKEMWEEYQKKIEDGKIKNTDYKWLGATYEMNGLDPKTLKNPFFKY